MSSTTSRHLGKITARIASIHIDPACNSFSNDCACKQFGMRGGRRGDPVRFQPAEIWGPRACACMTRMRIQDPEGGAQLALQSPPGGVRDRQKYAGGAALLGYGINAVLTNP
jgi:hypothetical protein